MIGGLWGNVKKKIGDEAGDLVKKVSEIDYNEVKEKGTSMFGYFFGNGENLFKYIFLDIKAQYSDFFL